jgi:ABC-type multidrug transport system fused ATPase/permease subunit
VSVAVLVDMGIIASGAAYVSPIIPVFLLVLYFIQYFYLRTSRQLRFLDLESKSPLFTHFTETASGMQHIRAFRWKARFRAQLIESLDRSQKPYYYLFCVQRWLGLVLDCCILVTAVVLIAVALAFDERTSETAIGLAMLSLITFSPTLTQVFITWVDLETSLGAISRIRSFCAKTPQEQNSGATVGGLLDWPTFGKVEFRNVRASYQ